jgi:hypothetical protein
MSDDESTLVKIVRVLSEKLGDDAAVMGWLLMPHPDFPMPGAAAMAASPALYVNLGRADEVLAAASSDGSVSS